MCKFVIEYYVKKSKESICDNCIVVITYNEGVIMPE